MTLTADIFPPLPLPDLPARPDVAANLDEQDFLSALERPLLTRSPTPGQVRLTLVFPDPPAGMTPVAFTDVLTHVHRGDLQAYALQPYSPASGTTEFGTTRWFAGCFDIPEGLTSAVGVLLIPTAQLADGTHPGTDRRRWRDIRSQVLPAWRSGELTRLDGQHVSDAIGSGSSTYQTPGTLNVLVDAHPEAVDPHREKHVSGGVGSGGHDSLNGVSGSGSANRINSTSSNQGFQPAYQRSICDHEVFSITPTGHEIEAWLALPAGEVASNILFVSDGGEYVHGTRLLPELTGGAGKLDDTAVVMFSTTKREQREEFLESGEKLAATLAEVLLPWAQWSAQARGAYIPVGQPERTTIAGGSMGGYAAADLVFNAGDFARNAIVQSASFWWPDYSYGLLSDWTAPRFTGSEPHRLIFHEYGEYDLFLHAENTYFAELLAQHERAGYPICSTSRVYRGGHDYLSWRRGIADGMAWIRQQRG